MGPADLVASAALFLGPVRLVSSADVRLAYRPWNDREVLAALAAAGWQGGSVGYFSVNDARYTRTETLLALLKRNGVAVDSSITPKQPLRLLWQVFRTRRRHTLIVLGFPGHHLLPFVRMLVGRRIPVVFDAFVSAYDTLCEDRGLFHSASIFGKALKSYDAWLCRLADAVLVDTQAHAAYFRETFGAKNVFAVYVECNDEVFHQGGVHTDSDIVLWYGSCIPLHGVEKILGWAKSLERSSRVRFRLIGPVAERYKERIAALKPSNVECVPWVDYADLPREIAAATLCLGGPFGESAKAKRVIAGKTYQMLACGAQVLVSDTEGNRELFGPPVPAAA